MEQLSLTHLSPGTSLETDLLIIGAGPAGITVAREFFGRSTRVLLVESGRDIEVPEIENLNRVDSIGEPRSPAQVERRLQYHKDNAPNWSHEQQPYGVRCRGVGGSTRAWAGKSAAFDPVDFQERAWVPHSGWPFPKADLEPFLERACEYLNLGPNVYDDRLWDLIGRLPPLPAFDPDKLRSFFWQFARSRIDPMDVMRFGPEFLRESAPNLRLLVNATATRILTCSNGSRVEGIEVACLEGARARIRAQMVVLAASGIENARLLLASNDTRPVGLGNDHDVVGRYLMDHVGARLGSFSKEDAWAVDRRFGLHGVRHRSQMHMCMHGLTFAPALQAREGLLNGAVYLMENRAADDPIDALKRLLRRNSNQPVADLVALLRSPWMVAKAVGIKTLQSRRFPERARRLIIDNLIKMLPGMVVNEHLDRGVPHKLLGFSLEGISEQRPDPNSRISLSASRDALGVPIPKVDWRVDEQCRRTLARLGQVMAEQMIAVGLPAPALESWVAEGRVADANAIDMAHTMGTTRMAVDPCKGVVDPHCKVHSVERLYIAGGSVFPTGGHANPTLMIMSIAIRLADHLKARLGAVASMMAKEIA
jgi:choline dehydrogenase-like flavoprotein